MDTLEQITAAHRAHPFTLPLPGTVIESPLTGDQYTIGAALDQGNFGDVFLCYDDWQHELVAKIIRPVGDFSETETRAVAEVTALALVRSPHIVHVHDTFSFKGACYIISERCDVTLRTLIQGGDMTAALWFPALAKAILHALHFVHFQGLAHCDVHAGNVFLRFIPDSVLPNDYKACIFKLGDFGLARPKQTMDPSGTFLTTLRPPEAFDPAEFGPLDYRSDLYQAGLLFLNFLSGTETLFTADDIISGRPRELADNLQHPAGAAIAKMLRRHAQFRPATALDAWREICPLLCIQ